jgi:hypothetical protein
MDKHLYVEWRDSQMTKKFVRLLEDAREAAIYELVGTRGQDPDYHRGAISALDNMLETIKTGDYLIGDE